MKQITVYIIGLLLIFPVIAGVIAKASKSGEEINWQVISSGGTDGASTNFQLSGTVAQTAVGAGSSPHFLLSHGYWQDFDTTGSGPCDCEPGETNADAAINIFDVTYLISHLYMSGPAPIPYALCNGDPIYERLATMHLHRLADRLWPAAEEVK